MKIRRRPSVIVVASLTAALVAGCSSGTETLRFVPSGGMANEAALSADAKMMWADVSYEVEGTLPEMPSEMVSYVVQKQSAPTQELQEIAKVFGVEGDVIEDPSSAGEYDSIFTSYRIGGENSDDEAMWMYGDGHWWSWSYYPGGLAFDSTISSDDMREPPSPPQNLPSKSEVETLTQELLNDLGISSTDVKTQAFSDEWSAWSQTNELIDGVSSPITWYFNFGEDGKLLSASGNMIDLKKGKSYDLADPTEAVSRLGDYRYYGGYGALDSRSASVSSSMSSTKEDLSSGATEPAPAASDVVTPDTTVEDVKPIDDVSPVDETPVEDTLIDVEPEKITITITSVEMSYNVMYEEDGKQTLMPAFLYSNEDGEVGSVIALSDDLFSFEEVTDTTIDGGEPMPEPDPGMDNPISTDEANTLIGLTEDEAMKVASSEGWEFRIAARDGEQYMLTADYIVNRVNVTIVEGTITEVTVG